MKRRITYFKVAATLHVWFTMSMSMSLSAVIAALPEAVESPGNSVSILKPPPPVISAGTPINSSIILTAMTSKTRWEGWTSDTPSTTPREMFSSSDLSTGQHTVTVGDAVSLNLPTGVASMSKVFGVAETSTVMNVLETEASESPRTTSAAGKIQSVPKRKADTSSTKVSPTIHSGTATNQPTENEAKQIMEDNHTTKTDSKDHSSNQQERGTKVSTEVSIRKHNSTAEILPTENSTGKHNTISKNSSIEMLTNNHSSIEISTSKYSSAVMSTPKNSSNHISRSKLSSNEMSTNNHSSSDISSSKHLSSRISTISENFSSESSITTENFSSESSTNHHSSTELYTNKHIFREIDTTSENFTRESSTRSENFSREITTTSDKNDTSKDSSSTEMPTSLAEDIPTSKHIYDYGTLSQTEFNRAKRVTDLVSIGVGAGSLLTCGLSSAVFWTLRHHSPANRFLLAINVVNFSSGFILLGQTMKDRVYGRRYPSPALVNLQIFSLYCSVSLRRFLYVHYCYVCVVNLLAVAYPMKGWHRALCRRPKLTIVGTLLAVYAMHSYIVLKYDYQEQSNAGSGGVGGVGGAAGGVVRGEEASRETRKGDGEGGGEGPGRSGSGEEGGGGSGKDGEEEGGGSRYMLVKSSLYLRRSRQFDVAQQVAEIGLSYLPLLGSAVLNVVLMVVLHRKKRERAALQEGRTMEVLPSGDRLDRQSLVILVSSLFFTALSLPSSLLQVIVLHHASLGFLKREHYLYKFLGAVFIVCQNASRFTSFLSYVTLSTSFRQRLIAMVCPCRKQAGKGKPASGGRAGHEECEGTGAGARADVRAGASSGAKVGARAEERADVRAGQGQGQGQS